MFYRLINPLKNKSFFIFGARGTGKSTLLRQHFASSALYLDLLDPVLEDRLLRQPGDLQNMVASSHHEWVIIDEVQKAPRLLDVVHRLIEGEKRKFILTGSSARKLKRGGANLLAGRALVYHLHPLVMRELGESFDLASVLQFGSLPAVLSASSARERKIYLQTYALTYMKEEVIAEQVLRRLDPFREFLRIAAEQSGRVVNHSAIAKQIGVDHKTVVNYFSVLEDTLLGFYQPSFHLSIRKSQIVAPKFYLFDLGVRNSLAEEIDLRPNPSTSFYGRLFEQFVILECFRLNSYAETNYRLSYFLTKSGFEVDLILSKGRRNLFVEIKSSAQVDPQEVARLKTNLANLDAVTAIYYVSNDPVTATIEGVRCLHWRDFLNEFFDTEHESL